VGSAFAANPRIAALLVTGACAAVGAVATVQAAVERYGYDPTGRLVQFVDSANEVTEYTYDAAGNLTSVTGGTAAGLRAGTSCLGHAQPDSPGRNQKHRHRRPASCSSTLQASMRPLSGPTCAEAATQVTADLTAGALVPLGPQTLTYANAAGTASVQITVAPVLPR